MSPYELSIVMPLVRALGQVQPVRSELLAAELRKSRRTAQYYLRRLEAHGFVERPWGQRSGWVAVH